MKVGECLIYQSSNLNKSYQFIGEYYVLAEHSEEELMNLNSSIGYALLLTLWINKQKKSSESRVEVLRRFIELMNEKNISKEEVKKLIDFAEILVTLPFEVKPQYEEIKKQKIKYMANIVVTPEREIAFQETINYLYSTRKTKEDLLNEGKKAGRLEGKRAGRLEGKRAGRLEGKRAGRLEGKREGKSQIAKSLKKQGVDFAIIVKATGLTIEEIKNL